MAEPYVAVGVGYSFGQKLKSVTGNENTNYPSAPDPLAAPLFPDSKVTDLLSKDSVNLSLRGGYYFPQYPSFGVEGEFTYSQPSFKRQNVTLTNSGFSAINPNGENYFTEDQLPATVNMFTIAQNFMYRYQGFEKFTPYVGIGPALFILHITGSGTSGNIVAPAGLASGGFTSFGPNINQTSVNLGLNVKTGVEYALTKTVGLAVDYHFDCSPIKVDNFRSLSNVKGHRFMTNLNSSFHLARRKRATHSDTLIILTAMMAIIMVLWAAFTPARAVERVGFDDYPAGTVVIKSSQRKLYLALGDGSALRYPVAVGKNGKRWQGLAHIDGKYIRPSWAPPEEVKRDHPNLGLIAEIAGNALHFPVSITHRLRPIAAIDLFFPNIRHLNRTSQGSFCKFFFGMWTLSSGSLIGVIPEYRRSMRQGALLAPQIVVEQDKNLKQPTKSNVQKNGLNRATPPARIPDHPGLAARQLAQVALAAVLESHAALGDWFEGPTADTMTFSMDDRDIALARSITLVTLRHLGTLRASIGRFLDRGLPRKSGPLEYVLLSGAAQILYMDVPDHAAVDLAVRLSRLDRNAAAFAGLVNAVLRNIIRNRASLAAASPQENTPEWLFNSWSHTYGETKVVAIAKANMHEPSLDLTVKSDAAGWAQKLNGVVLANGSVRLREHQPIPQLEGFADGEYWVQDAAASLPARLLKAKSGEMVADLCAAPGGKTAQLAMTGAKVTAFDRSAFRLKRVTENLARLKLNAEIRAVDILTLGADQPKFDAILLDAPCSATGTIRRHPDVAWTKQPGDVAALAEIQSQMLDKAYDLLKPKGRLVYCVCSLENEEGPQQISAFLQRHPDMIRIRVSADDLFGKSAPTYAQLVTQDGELRTLPCDFPDENPRLAGLDGFYAASLMRGS
eukprot:gene12736-12832_t